eukprot:TRINITY_DN1599_c0_g4_i1.p1 TRINITY_DN1599_c0_g4~~TRINITY_DN1599_c0_g4_i1.p1  ORF type:complete len:129 (-),score=58.38 TRINITY_DN1599_c0_g4_i1:108-494(-)
MESKEEVEAKEQVETKEEEKVPEENKDNTTQAQKKKKKKKKPEQAPKDAEQPEEKAGEEEKTDFEKELNWCLNQLKLGLQRNAVTSDQVKQTTEVINILESKTAPIVKKRHLMRVVFGDYRKLMKQIK